MAARRAGAGCRVLREVGTSPSRWQRRAEADGPAVQAPDVPGLCQPQGRRVPTTNAVGSRAVRRTVVRSVLVPGRLRTLASKAPIEGRTRGRRFGGLRVVATVVRR